MPPNVSQYLRPLRRAPNAPIEMPPMKVSSRRVESGSTLRAAVTSSSPTKRP